MTMAPRRSAIAAGVRQIGPYVADATADLLTNHQDPASVAAKESLLAASATWSRDRNRSARPSDPWNPTSLRRPVPGVRRIEVPGSRLGRWLAAPVSR